MLVVCATDFSEPSRQGLAAAGALVPRLHPSAELRLVHVLDSGLRFIGSAALASVETAARTRLEEEARWLQERTTARVGTALLSGGAADTLTEFANANGAQLVIVASQGHGDSLVYRVGGTSERLAQSSPLPTLVVRDAAPFEAWAKGARPLRILLAVDWTSNCEAAIRFVKSLRAGGPCDVVVGHIYASGSLGEGASRYGLTHPTSMMQPDPEVERLVARDLASRVGDLGGKGEVVFRARHGIGRLGDHLLALAETERVDLIVTGTHHKRGLSRLASVAAVTLHHGRSAVAVVPAPQDELAAPEEVPRLRRVLIPTDLSPISNYAVPFGYALVGDRGGEVYLLHVLEDAPAAGAAVDIAARLRSLVPARGLDGSVTTRTEVVQHEDVSRAINEAAERLGVDAICMGSHGRTGLQRTVLGSVAETVVRESRRPVLIVRSLPPA